MLTTTRRTLLGAVPALALASASRAAQAATSLHLIYAYYSEATKPVVEGIVAAYQKANPDVTINAEEVGWDNLQQRFTTDISGGTAPDIGVIATRWLLDYAKQNIAEPLDGYMSPEYKGQFFETLLTPSTIDGKIWGLPFVASTRALYCNTELLQQAGVAAPPTTWDELRAAAAKVKQAGKAYGFAIQGKEIETDTYWYYALWTHGGEIVRDGKSALTAPEAVAATKMYHGLIADGLTQPTPTAYNRQDVETLFKQGRVAMIATGPWLRGQLAKEAPNVKYTASGLPTATRKATWGGTDSVVLFASGANKPAAWKFMSEGLVTPASTLELTKREGFLPVTKSAAEDPQVKADLGAFTALLPYAKFAPQIPNWEQIVDVTISALQTVYLGRSEAEPALAEAAKKVDALLV